MTNPLTEALPTTVAGLPTWLLVALLVIVLVVVLLPGSDRGRGRRRGRRGGRIGGLPILLIVGLLLGATPAGGSIIRTIVTTIAHAMNTFGGFYGG